jgi:hypothetical protein
VSQLPTDSDRWALWDAGSLISLHPTEQAAFAARDDHLTHLVSESEDDLPRHHDAVEIVDNETEPQ